MASYIICGVDIGTDWALLAEHVKKTHGRQARKAYKEGKWTMSDNQPDNLFANVDSPTMGAESVGGNHPTKDSTVDRPEAPLSIQVVTQPSYIEPKADLIYGATGSGKTRNIGRISDYILAKYGKLTRVVSADGGGLGPASGKGKSGQIEFWAVGARKWPIAAIYKAVRGWWPLRLDDPESPLVPPDAGTWEVYGYGAFEGLTSFGDLILDNLKATKASLSQDPSYTFTQDGVEFSGGNQSYYGFMQDNLHAYVTASHLLGYEKISWTAQESKGDDQGGSKVYGPMIGGKKAIGKAGGWFLNVWHMEVVAGPQHKDEASGQLITEGKYLLFLKTHIEPSTLIPFPCKARFDDAPVYIESGNADEAYRLMDKAYEKQALESTAKMNEITGLRDRLMERAIVARKREAEAAEKRAKASNLLKPMVSVPGMPTLISPVSPVSSPVAPKVAGPVAPKAPVAGPVAVPMPTISLPVPTIQNVRRGNK